MQSCVGFFYTTTISVRRFATTDRGARADQATPKEGLAVKHTSPVNALSFDIEDWFHMIDVPAVSDPSRWDTLPSIVERYTRWIVETVSAADVKATFFVLGWVAQRYPHLVRMISDAGHEVACHSYWHRRVDQLTPDEFYEDVQKSIDVIQQTTGTKVLGFRAPGFSITPGTEWAFDILHDLGLSYDSSLIPAKHAHGGYPCHLAAHTLPHLPSGPPMLELPVSVVQFGAFRMPFSGGGYVRLLPPWLIRYGFQRCHRKNLPVVVYLHPRDLAPDCPRVDMPFYRRFKCYIGLKSTKNKLRQMLKIYRFDTCAAVLKIDDRLKKPDRRLAAHLT